MRTRPLKYQFSAFGSFSFPATPECTISLMQRLLRHSLMPTVVQGIDFATGQMSPRISLSKAGDIMQVVFGNDRIDLMEHFPAGDRTPHVFLRSAREVFSDISELLPPMSRVAFVKELLTEEIPRDNLNALSGRLFPEAPPDLVEWTYKFVKAEDKNKERFMVSKEHSKMSGFLVQNGRQTPFDGVRSVYDISTAPDLKEPRFNARELSPICDELTQLFESTYEAKLL